MSTDPEQLLHDAHVAVQRAQAAIYANPGTFSLRDRLAVNAAQSNLIRVLVRRAKRRDRAQVRMQRPPGGA